MSEDPFQKAKDIRDGKLDAEMPMYDELTGWMQRVPVTWLPGLLHHIVWHCVKRKVFKPGGLERRVEYSKNSANDPHSMLREDMKP